jgi:hypothetical protein
VPGGTAHWAFTGNGNYNDQAGDVSITLTKIDATCSVSGYSGVYDATAHGASGSCSGIGEEDAGTLDLGASYTDVPGGTAHWAFTGNGNYNDQEGDVSITLTKIDATCSVSGYSGVYDATPHGASGFCEGIGGEDAGTLDLGASYTDVPGGTAHWAFTGNGNYNDRAGDVSITLIKAVASCSISGYSGVYDATPHGASGFCEGIGGEIAGTLDPGASYTDVPGGTAHWTFTGNSNYNNQSGDVLITITKVQITVTADNKTKVVGEPDPLLTYSYLPGLLLPGDNFTGELTREPGENVGSYAIQRGTLSLSNNYNLFFVEGTFTISNGVIYLPLIIR